MTAPIALHTATVVDREVTAWLVDGRLVLTTPQDTIALKLAVDEADAIATFIRTSVERALLHGARKDGT